ncbi:EAL domain-containing protein [Sulfurimonas sp. RIFOXYB12_FULL_35_9]|uniref:EAL domain-containing protein n=1 Tax=Sulfurimonas sp. RIFOXYB12_FULL_35_9 TaxID=1802256 RepID=UPI0008C6C10A|nr:EAL domain-containing protein [Sulfurimonas sp. RIFOXYB12_FULL_35_9]MBS4068374.1 EAL domain-containing protein [Sulfurimonas sp.]OHE06211.1 MAG: hypothetical protein A2345_00365 [Sulfurimonas sp. RIFOXYB12_FULL_35_9]
MRQQKDFILYFTLFVTLVLPICMALYMQNFAAWKYESLPLHSFLEASGAVVAIMLSLTIFIIHQGKLELNYQYYASFGLICMGVFDAFHSTVMVGDTFVWLHALSVFFGGIFFNLVWLSEYSISRKRYFIFPITLFFISVFIAIISILYPQILPQMLTKDGEFTNMANLLNVFGGSMFILSSFYFIRTYLSEQNADSLLFAGHTMLLGTSGVLFFFSSIWDMQWWFWHFLRFFAYLIAFYFMLRSFYNSVLDLDITNKKFLYQNRELNESGKLLLEYKKAIFEGSIISASDLNGRITYVNEEFEKISGYSKDELIGKGHNILRHPQTPKSTFKDLWETIQSKRTWKGLIKNINKEGKSFCTKTTVIPITDSNDNIIEYLALREDVTELVSSQEELKKNFYTDRLTNLSNRYKLFEDLKNTQNANIAILNIDNFKHINDFYGDSFGDKVLIKISSKLLDISYKLRYNIYRNHADEFSIVSFLDDEDNNTFIKHIKEILLNMQNSALKVDEEELSINFSAGISLGFFDLQFADIALKEAKKFKKDFIVYSHEMTSYEDYKNNLIWVKRIKDALVNDRVVVVFQPILNNKTNTIDKYESLVRIIDEDDKIVSPYHFLDIAKQSKLYPQITKRVFEKVFKHINFTNKSISVNITAEDILNKSTKEFIINQLQELNNKQNVIFELVESEGIESFDDVKLFIDEIKTFGCKIAIDDFGTGYSNFEYLLKLEADIIKIDGSLIKNIDTDINNYNVVESIVSFAKKNNIKIVAEFVSSQKIQDKIILLDIEYSQGYLISEPKFWEEL